MYENVGGAGNTAVGYQALQQNQGGNNNVAIGNGAGPTNAFPNLSNAIAIGLGAVNNASDQVRIGNTFITSIGGYAAWTNLSDARFKRDIAPENHGLDFILKLEPITYHMDLRKLNAHLGVDEERFGSAEHQKAIADKERITYSGFSAQQVEQAAMSVGYDFSGVHAPQNEHDHYALAYAEFVVPLVKAVQEQQAMIEEQRALIKQLQQRLENVEHR